jgi:hypothetical protein
VIVQSMIQMTTHLSHSVSICVEEAKGVVRTAVDSQRHFGDIIIGIWSCLGSTDWALVAGITDAELVVVGRVWLELLCLDLGRYQPLILCTLIMHYLDCIVNI